ANDVASDDQYSETTVACTCPHTAYRVSELFEADNFRTFVSTDVRTVELCGALKNVIAVGAGLCDGMGASASAKAALLRQGLKEMAAFCMLYDTGGFQLGTLLCSAGVADLTVTCYAGRNRR
ncbi:NAD-dependent glycerol-3-phosphate dehydrogenase C-terminus-domain-containing protein, partial [Ochromonadaceae sp. CCMP2298]